MNFQFKTLTVKDFLIAIAVTVAFLFVMFSPKVAPHAWAGENTSPAYVCLETNSAAAQEEMARIIQGSDARLVNCDDPYDYRIVVQKEEARHGASATEVWISFNVYDIRENNITHLPSMSSGPYYRHESEAIRNYNVVLQIQRVIRENRETYLGSINSL